jgi:hypothetical protein
MNDEELLAEERLYQEAKAEISGERSGFLLFHEGSVDIDDCLEIAKQVQDLYNHKLMEFYNAHAAARHQAELAQLVVRYPRFCLCNFDGKHPDRTRLEIARVEMHDTCWDAMNGRMRQCQPYPEYWYRCVECGKEWNPVWRIEDGKLMNTMRYA